MKACIFAPITTFIVIAPIISGEVRDLKVPFFNKFSGVP